MNSRPEHTNNHPSELDEKFSGSVSLLVWGYNEEALVDDFLNKALVLMESVCEDFEVVFIDDGSTDSTGSVVQERAKVDPRICYYRNDVNRNVGYSCARAIREATKDYLFWQTVDWSYDLSEIRRFLELLRHFDVVQGCRPVPERLLSHIPVIKSVYRLKTRSDNLPKALVSLGNYYVLRILFGVPFSDFQNVTFYPRHLIQSAVLQGNSSFLNPECLFHAYRHGAQFIEVPINFFPRTEGESKGTKFGSVLRSVSDILKAWVKWGWRLRFSRSHQVSSKIYRANEPARIPDNLIALVSPLGKYYRSGVSENRRG